MGCGMWSWELAESPESPRWHAPLSPATQARCAGEASLRQSRGLASSLLLPAQARLAGASEARKRAAVAGGEWARLPVGLMGSVWPPVLVPRYFSLASAVQGCSWPAYPKRDDLACN